LGFEGFSADTVTTKCCLRKRLVDPTRDLQFFRDVATNVSRLKRWGATLGHAAIVRELEHDPTGASLGKVDETFWINAALTGGYGGQEASAKKFQAPLKRAFRAPLSQGGFNERPSADAPFADGTAEERTGLLSNGLLKCLRYAMKAHHTVFETGLWINFSARLGAAVRWWASTHLPFAAKAEDAARRHAIICAITGEPCETLAPQAAGKFIALHRTRMFGEGGVILG